MHSIETVPSSEKILTPEELHRLLYNSFLLSQGDPGLQIYLIRAARLYYGKQPSVTAETIETFFKTILTKPDANNDAKLQLEENEKHQDTKPNDIKETMLQLTRITKVLSDEEILIDQDEVTAGGESDLDAETVEEVLGVSKIELYELISSNIWLRDMGFITPSNSTGRKNSPFGDPWFSSGVHHIIRSEPVPEPALRSVFKELSKLPPESFWRDDITKVVEAYNQHHPENPVSKEELDEYLNQ